MTYTEIVSWLFDQLPYYQKQGASALKFGLDKISAFCSHLNNPQQSLKIIHIGGTNGKGSTTHLMASVLQENGFRVGVYTSPHLVDFRERIKINGSWIDTIAVENFILDHKEYIVKEKLTFFEITFALAVQYFFDQKVDYALIEVGMGGRLDATNIVCPILSVITNIGLDHTQFLGTTHTAIAGEKAGIIKDYVPVVIGESRVDTQPVFELEALNKKAPILFADTIPTSPFLESITQGAPYQYKNRHTAYCALRQIPDVSLSDALIEKGFRKVNQNTMFMGRWQQLSSPPKVIVDVSHNREGFVYLSKALKELSYRKLHLVLGFVQDKPVQDLLRLLPSDALYHLAAPDLFRAFPIDALIELVHSLGVQFRTYSSVLNAYSGAMAQAAKDDLVLVTGSTFVVAEVIENFQDQ